MAWRYKTLILIGRSISGSDIIAGLTDDDLNRAVDEVDGEIVSVDYDANGEKRSVLIKYAEGGMRRI